MSGGILYHVIRWNLKYYSKPLQAAPMALEKRVHSLPYRMYHVEHVTPSIVKGVFYPIDSLMVSRLYIMVITAEQPLA
jgi:hypothetical protein